MVRTRKLQLIAIILIAVAVPSFGQPATAHSTIQYINKQFGFRFTLPSDWRGYRIVMDEWSGIDDMANVKGPLLRIRNSHWTERNPWQDIPIMIFTLSQWSLVDDGILAVSAAPIGPGEIGRNEKYVFAIPPRSIGFDEEEGYMEVAELLKGHPLQALK